MENDTNKKLEVNFVLACDYAFLAEGRKLSIIGVFDFIGSDKFPTMHPEMFLVINFKGKSGSEHELKMEIKDPQGKNIFPNIQLLKIKLGSLGTGNFIHRFLNFPLNIPGEHTFSLYEKERKIARFVLSALKVENSNKNKLVS